MATQRQNSRCGTSGLTLVELVLAILVVGMIAASITTIFGAASDLVEKGRDRGELVQSGRVAMNRLLAELGTAVTIEARLDNLLRIRSVGVTNGGGFNRFVTFWAADGTLWRPREILPEKIRLGTARPSETSFGC